MSPLRRRQVRPLKHPYLLPLAMAGALALLAAAWLLLRAPEPDLPPVYTAQSAVLCQRQPEEIARLTVHDPAAAPYTILQTRDGWQLEGRPDFVFRESMLNSMLANASLIAADDTVGDRGEHPEWAPENFGLGDSALRVAVQFTDGTGLAFRIGDAVPQETPAYYFLLEGDSRIFTVAADIYESFSNSLMTLHEVTDPALKGELIDSIAFSGENAFTARRQPDGWCMTAPFAYPLSDAAVQTLLDKLEGLRFAQFVAPAAQADLPALGLEPPLRTLTLDIAPSIVTGYDENGQVTGEKQLDGYQLTFGLGRNDSEVVFYCLYQDEVVKATVFSAGFLLAQSWDTLLLSAPFNAPTNDLQRLTVQRAGEAETVYDLSLQERVLPNNDFETDENGNVLHDLLVARNGEAADSDAFLAAYDSLVQLRTEDRLPADYALPAEPPLLRITLTRSASVREVALYPLDALHNAVAVNGKALFRVEKGWAESVIWP